MTYANESIISFLTNSSTCFILLTVLYLSLACLLYDAKILTACQLLHKKGEGDSVPEWEEDDNADTLYFFNTGIGL